MSSPHHRYCRYHKHCPSHLDPPANYGQTGVFLTGLFEVLISESWFFDTQIKDRNFCRKQFLQWQLDLRILVILLFRIFYFLGENIFTLDLPDMIFPIQNNFSFRFTKKIFLLWIYQKLIFRWPPLWVDAPSCLYKLGRKSMSNCPITNLYKNLLKMK